MYALIEYAGKQYKVEEGMELKVPHVTAKEGSKVSIDKILYFDDGSKQNVGSPYIKNMSIDAKVLSHGRERKVIVFKFKRRKGYQRKNGHRQEFSTIKIGKLGSAKKATPKTKAKTAKPKATKKPATKKPAAKKSTAKKSTAKKESK